VIPVGTNVSSRRWPLVTVLLVAANLYGFWRELLLPDAVLASFIDAYGVVPLRVQVALDRAPLALDAWLVPLFTSMFLHGGWAHLLGNMVFLFVFGRGVESRLGHGRFLVFYLVAGVVAAAVQIWLSPGSRVPMVGASGAISGVLGAFLLLHPRARVVMLIPIFFWPFFFEVSAFFFLAVWFVEQAWGVATMQLIPGLGEGIAFGAHVGGFVGGALLLPFLAERGRPEYHARRPVRRQYRTAFR
jgi:membrane associated rhomboid family serine protease